MTKANAQYSFYIAQFAGSGTSWNPYQITSPLDLFNLDTIVSYSWGDSIRGKYFKLMNDIDMIGIPWKAIGYSSHNPKHFQGHFDGNYKVIRNLTCKNYGSTAGLFHSFVDGAIVKNLGIENCDMESYMGAGGLASNVQRGCKISNCYVTGSVKGGLGAGGLIGIASCADISNCYFSGNVSNTLNGTGAVGGLVGGFSGICMGSSEGGGNLYQTIISNCYVTGKVTAVGYNASVGGLVGGFIDGIIRNCVVALDSLTSDTTVTFINRIVGALYLPSYDPYYIGPILQNNYALNTMVVQNQSGNVPIVSHLDLVSGMSIPLDSLKKFSFYNNTFNNWHYSAPWSIQNPLGTWKICDEQDLPFLRYQGIICNYDITATAGIGGNISPSGTVSVVENTNQTFTFSANTCYEIDSLFIDGKYAPDSIATGSYTFENVTKNHTIEVCFKKIKYGSAFAKTTCENMPYILGNQILTKSGVYYDTLYALNGCDSIVELTLTINPTYFMSDTAIICEDESYNFNGNLLTTSGIYYDTLPTIHGCDSVFRLNLTVNPVPDTTIYFSDNMLIVSGLMGNQYQWYFNGTSIPDATKQVHTYTQNGVYYVIIINRYGCSSKSREIDITDVGVINYELRIKNYVIYPNPTDGKITINNEQLTIKNVEIYDVVGKKQQAECRKQNGEIIMDISHLANGLYFLKVDGKVVKVMKE